MHRPGGGYKWLAIMGLLALAWLPVGSHASMEDHFASGVEAARHQDYAAALRYFQAAERAGMRKPLLYYNLGVSYYREHRLDKAEEAFKQAAKSAELAALSYYNLGLIARDRGQREQAINQFRQAAGVAQTEQMRRLSKVALEQMAEDSPTEVPPPWLLWAEGNIGYDNNAASAADFTTETGGADETFGFSAYGQYDFTRLRLHGLVDMEHYSELDDFNFDMLGTGLSLPLRGDSWTLAPGLSLRHLRLGGEPLQDSAALLLESTAQAGDFELTFYLEHESVMGADIYEYLDGTRDYFQARAGAFANRWWLIWDIEFNEREDLSRISIDGASADFFSFSPQRRQWQLEYRNPLTDNLDLRLTAGLQNSRYSDPEIRDNDVMARREDTRTRLIVELGYKYWRDWRSSIELMYLETNSNFEEFEYDRGVITLNVGRNFGE